ncbi:SRPBCC family protein [Nonomuraea sp. NPDC049750]|uniref:SRPBCC family protein n=2 Tax=unclassified Nonomuraea TaxID=2593643 RepID=UPI0034051EA3
MLRSLLYSGPPLEVLHEQYAKNDRIDATAPVRAVTRVIVDRGPEVVWSVLADPEGWSRIDPAIGDVRLTAGVAVDAAFTWRNGKAAIASRFAVAVPGRQLTWTGLSFGAKAVHRHVLTPLEDGSTELMVAESMAGPLLGLFMNGRKLQAALDEWAAGIKRVAEARSRGPRLAPVDPQ